MGTETNTAAPLELQENDDGSVEILGGEVVPSGTVKPAADEGEDARVVQDGADAAAAATAEAEELAAAGSDEEREAIRARRRQERKDRRQRQRDKFEDLRSELAARDRIIDELRTRMDTADRRSTGADMAALDARIRREEENLSYLTNVISDGTKVANGEAVAQATLQMTEVQQNLSQLRGFRERVAASY